MAHAEEKITLRAHYGFVTAGYAELTTASTPHAPLIHSRLRFQSTKLVDKLFRFTYIFDSYYEPTDCYPQEFSYYLVEKKRTFNDTVRYHHAEKYLETLRHGKIPFAESPRDFLSVIARLRGMDWAQVLPGDTLSFDIIFRGKDIFPVHVHYQGKERLSVTAGDYDCMKLRLKSEAGKLFFSDSDVTIYLSDDARKIPVMITVDVFIGAFKLEMADYEPARDLALKKQKP